MEVEKGNFPRNLLSTSLFASLNLALPSAYYYCTLLQPGYHCTEVNFACPPLLARNSVRSGEHAKLLQRDDNEVVGMYNNNTQRTR